MNRRGSTSPAVLILALAFAGVAEAAKISFSEKGFVDVGALIQAQYRATQNGAADGHDVSNDFLLRRARLLLSGQYNDQIGFIINTDITYGAATIGGPTGGTAWNNTLILNEALGIFKVSDALIFDAGLMLLPFSHNVLTSSSRLATLDARGNLTKYSLNSQRNNRDVGFEVRGLLLSDRIYYRIGIWNGVQTTPPAGTTPGVNPGDAPRFAGMIRFNILGKEDGYTWCGICFAKTPTLNVGVSADIEPNAVRGAVGKPGSVYRSYVADAFLNLPVGENQELSFEVAVVKFDVGEQVNYFVPATPTAASSFGANSGIGSYGHIAYRFGVIAPVFSMEWFNSNNTRISETNPGNLVTYRFGLNWYLEKHVYNLKAEFAIQDKQGAGTTGVDGKPISDNQWVLTIQAQVAF
jgi:Phosphate-selective porin O and P